jgi:UDP:flavonoid glycosyltransferase YjiC (YdhE family)
LFSTTANDGHFGPLLPFAHACVASGHHVRVAAPVSYGPAVARADLTHEPFADPPPELIGPVMAGLPALTFEDANEVVIREVFGRIDAQAALPALLDIVREWRPHVIVRESAELASVVAAERFGIPHVHVCIGMHEVAARFAEAISAPLQELGRKAALTGHDLTDALAAETVLSLIPEALDCPSRPVPPEARAFRRFRQPLPAASHDRPPAWGNPDLPLLYVTFGSVAGSLAPFAGVFREALDALATLDAHVVMTTGRTFDISSLGPVPDNALVVPWLPQEQVLAHAAALLGHGGLGTTLGAVAAGVPQVVAPLFSFDQVVNGDHVASVGAGLVVEPGPTAVTRAAGEIASVMGTESYAQSARRMATAVRDLPPAAAAVRLLTHLAYP